MPVWTRREFLTFGASGIVLLAGGGVVFRLLGDEKHAQPIRSNDALQPQASEGARSFPEIKNLSLPLPLWITENDDFYDVKFDEMPSVSLTSWSLTVHGMVREQVRLTYDEVRSLPSRMTMHTLECIGNPVGGNLIGNAEWRGISFRSLLERAGVDPSAAWVVIGGVDEYFTSVPLATAMNDHAMLAYDMNGVALPPRHGFPLRAILPGVYGQKQPKWVTGIKVTSEEELGPWEQKGWSKSATIQLNSAIRNPKDDEKLGRGDILIAGVAHANEIGIGAVEVSTDGGKNWNETVLTRGPSPFVWTQWGYVFKIPAPGKYRLMVRARDVQGNVQNQTGKGILADVYPNGTSEIHSIVIQVSEV